MAEDNNSLNLRKIGDFCLYFLSQHYKNIPLWRGKSCTVKFLRILQIYNSTNRFEDMRETNIFVVCYAKENICKRCPRPVKSRLILCFSLDPIIVFLHIEEKFNIGTKFIWYEDEKLQLLFGEPNLMVLFLCHKIKSNFYWFYSGWRNNLMFFFYKNKLK